MLLRRPVDEEPRPEQHGGEEDVAAREGDGERAEVEGAHAEDEDADEEAELVPGRRRGPLGRSGLRFLLRRAARPLCLVALSADLGPLRRRGPLRPPQHPLLLLLLLVSGGLDPLCDQGDVPGDCRRGARKGAGEGGRGRGRRGRYFFGICRGIVSGGLRLRGGERGRHFEKIAILTEALEVLWEADWGLERGRRQERCCWRGSDGSSRWPGEKMRVLSFERAKSLSLFRSPSSPSSLPNREEEEKGIRFLSFSSTSLLSLIFSL